jgi:hypothetical protein
VLEIEGNYVFFISDIFKCNNNNSNLDVTSNNNNNNNNNNKREILLGFVRFVIELTFYERERNTNLQTEREECSLQDTEVLDQIMISLYRMNLV